MAWTIEERDGVGHGRLWIMDEHGRCVCTVYREIDDPWRVARAIAALPTSVLFDEPAGTTCACGYVGILTNEKFIPREQVTDELWRLCKRIAELEAERAATDAAIRQDQAQRVSLEDGTGPTSYIERDADGLPTRMWFSMRREG